MWDRYYQRLEIINVIALYMLPLNPRANIFMYKRNSISFYTYFSPRMYMLYVYIISIAESYRFKSD